MRGPILITGGTGQVGQGLLRQAGRCGIAVEAPGRAHLDLASPESIVSKLRENRWSAVINCAAYTAVDAAESDRQQAFMINAEAPGIIAAETGERHIPMLHISTDYVFDGSKHEPYREDDPVAPLGCYGASKLAGEAAVREANPLHAIIRTSWLVSPWGRNFMKTMVRLAEERDEISVVADQVGSPTSAIDLAAVLLVVADRMVSGAQGGTWHFCNRGTASWFDLAVFVVGNAGEATGRSVAVRPIATVDYPTPARRPARSVLATDKIEHDFGIRPQEWRTAVGRDLAMLLSDQHNGAFA